MKKEASLLKSFPPLLHNCAGVGGGRGVRVTNLDVLRRVKEGGEGEKVFFGARRRGLCVTFIFFFFFIYIKHIYIIYIKGAKSQALCSSATPFFVRSCFPRAFLPGN